MKMTHIHITNLAYFLTGSLKWEVLWGKEKYLLNSLYEKLENKVSLKWIYTVKNLSLSMTSK